MKFLKVACILALALSTLVLAVASELPSASTRTVSGHRIGHYKDGPVPVDLSVRMVAAYVPDGQGGYSQIVGTGTEQGTFMIPGVPKGYYLLRLGGQYLWTSNSNVNADYNLAYRSSAAPPADPTSLSFNLANLNAWKDTDYLEFVDSNAIAFQSFPGIVGATAFTGTFDYETNLADYTQGDKTYILQLATQHVGGFYFTAAARFLALKQFVQTDGSNVMLTGTLKTVPQDQAFRANIAGEDLAALTLAANPGASLSSTQIALDINQGSLAKGWTTATPDLVSYGLDPARVPMLTVSQDFGDIFYGNPFPTSWPLFVIYQYTASTNYTAPDASNPVQIPSRVLGTSTTMPSHNTPVAPMVGTVLNPLVGTGSFFADLSGIGLTPTLTWQAPSIGASDAYQVYVYELDNDAGNTVYGQVARLETQANSITLPPGILNPGTAYVFLIRTMHLPGMNVAKRPYAIGPVYATADVLSGIMQP